jgi:hypothetical protein
LAQFFGEKIKIITPVPASNQGMSVGGNLTFVLHHCNCKYLDPVEEKKNRKGKIY